MTDPLLSVITPVFNEEDNLADLHAGLCRVLDAAGLRWEWHAVDDGSTDASAEKLHQLAAGDARVRVIRQERNLGSHAAILRGLREARGDAAVVLAADLQDSPEVITKLFDTWQSHGAALVWAARTRPEGATAWDRLLSASYHRVVRAWTGLPAPRFGADCFLADRRVPDALARSRGIGPSLFLHLLSLPVPQQNIPHDREPRRRGKSGWSAIQKARLAITSLLAWTNPRSWMERTGDLIWRMTQGAAAPGADRALKRLSSEWLRAHPVGGRHLDVGCGSHSRLASLGVQAMGVDWDAGRIAQLRRRGDVGVHGSATNLPFVTDAFGAVWSFGLLHHLSDAEVERSISEMERVTAPGGWMIAFDGVRPLSRWDRPLASLVRALDAGGHVRTEPELRAVLARTGNWTCHRVTYAWNGLEGLFCWRQKTGDMPRD